MGWDPEDARHGVKNVSDSAEPGPPESEVFPRQGGCYNTEEQVNHGSDAKVQNWGSLWS